MKKSLLSISFLAMSVASFAATYSGTLAGTVAGGELEAKVEVTVADGNEGQGCRMIFNEP